MDVKNTVTITNVIIKSIPTQAYNKYPSLFGEPLMPNQANITAATYIPVSTMFVNASAKTLNLFQAIVSARIPSEYFCSLHVVNKTIRESIIEIARFIAAITTKIIHEPDRHGSRMIKADPKIRTKPVVHTVTKFRSIGWGMM